jgi:23S rRNA (cytosine1962-C5)-methyltransferase
MQPLFTYTKDTRDGSAGPSLVFSNEIASDLGTYEPGSLVDVYTHGGTFVGRGYINPRSLITVRILSPRREVIDSDFFRSRFSAALQRRARLFPGVQSYRLVYSEGDLLPGLIVDRYQDHLVADTHPGYGLADRGHLRGSGAPSCNPKPSSHATTWESAPWRAYPTRKKVLRGHLQTPVEVWENDIRFRVDLWEGKRPVSI